MPSEWSVPVRFSDVLIEPVRNGLYKSKEFHGRGTKIVNMGELFAHPRLGNVPMRRIELTEKEKSKSLLKVGDLLFARRSLVAEGAGRCTLLTEASEETVFESSIIRARPDPLKADSRYLYYFFASPYGRERMHGILRQVAVAGITGTDLSEMEIALPGLDQQKAVADSLSSLDDRIDLLRQTNATLEAIAQALFKSWFVDFDPVRAKAEGREPGGMDAETAALFPSELEESELGLIPKGWRRQSLADAFDINPKRVLSKGSNAPYLDMASVRTSGHVADRPISRLFSSGSKFQNGDTLLARITPCLENGKTAHVDFLEAGQVGWGSTEFIVLRPKGAMPPFAGYLLARQDDFRAFAVQAMSGSSGRQRVELTQLTRFPVIVPPDAIAAIFGDLVEPLRASITANECRAAVLADLRNTLLPRLISGKLRLPNVESVIEEALA